MKLMVYVVLLTSCKVPQKCLFLDQIWWCINFNQIISWWKW